MGFKRFALWAVCGLVLSGACACAPSQATHFSGQIGRFYGEGISFTVPMVGRAEKAGQEDHFWEIRRGIADTIVVVLQPAEASQKDFRVNMALTAEKISEKLTAEEFRAKQLEEIKSQSSALGIEGEIATGLDEAGPWAQFKRSNNGMTTISKAWFFTPDPDAENVGEEAYVLLGMTKDTPKAVKDLQAFAQIAATVKIGRPNSGFSKLALALSSAASQCAAPQEKTPVETAVPLETAPQK